MSKISMTVDEAVKYCGIGRSKLYEIARDGEINLRKAGKRTLILTEELDAYVRSLPTTKTAA